MRRFFSTSFIALALFAGAASVAHAAPGDPCDADGNPGTLNASGLCVPNGAVPATPTTTSAPKIDPVTANVLANPPLAGDTASQFGTIMTWIMTLFAWLVGVAAITLDNAVYYTVVTMGSYVNHLSAIGVTWRVLRDIGNIMLIFGFLAIGITTILNVNWYGGGQKMLPGLLAAAIFLNFSLFISEAIVDTGNLFATQFYTQINGGKPAGAKSFDAKSIANDGISNKIMAQLGLQGIYGDTLTNKEIFKAGNSWLIGFMGIILFLVTAFVLFSLAFILIARFVALIFLIIAAPIGFAGLAIPGFAARARDYWTQLFNQTITAPILLLMLYLALAVITDAQFMTGFGSSTKSGGWTGFIQNAAGMNNLTGFASLVLSFLVAMGLLLLVVVYSKRWSAFGGDWATKTAGKLSFGIAGSVGRTAVGWPANALARYTRSTRLAQVPIVGTSVVGGLNRLAGASFDFRGAGLIKNAPFGKTIETGAAQKGGYAAELKAGTEARTKYAATLTGRKLTELETAAVAAKENEIAELRKSQKGKSVTEILNINQQIKAKEKEIEELEKGTDKGSKRQYARNLELGYLGLDEKSFFNKYINFAANTEGAKKIREDAKKSKDDKELDALRKALKKAGGEEEGGGGAPPPPPPPAGGAPGGGAA